MAHAVPQAGTRIFVYVSARCESFVVSANYNSTLDWAEWAAWRVTGTGYEVDPSRSLSLSLSPRACGQRVLRLLVHQLCLRSVVCCPGDMAPKQGTVRRDKDRRSLSRVGYGSSGQVVWQLYSTSW